MYIVMISPECTPIAKVGGLGDVVIGLSKALESLGHQVDIILPKYDKMRYDKIKNLHSVYENLLVPYGGRWFANEVMAGTVDGVNCYFIDTGWYKNFFNRGTIYGEKDDAERFAYFSKAALEFLYKTEKTPDCIHCHDWPTSLVPVFLEETYRELGMEKTRAVYTIHNFEHQGITHETVMVLMGLSAGNIPPEAREMGQYGYVNVMKEAIIYSDFVTTVSPTYSREVMFTDKGMGLQGVLHAHQYKFAGLINGIDYEYWNPQTDRDIPHHYNSEDLMEKYKNKAALRERLGLADEFCPLVAMVSRLVWQKGVDLMKNAIYYSLGRGAQVVLLGSSPDPRITADFEAVKKYFRGNPNCHLELGFNEELSHLIYAGSDLLVVPSIFEPCGLTQMIAMRYGSVPVVRSTGGLADTVFDAEFSEKPWQQRNGYTFEDATQAGVESAIQRAIHTWFTQPHIFRQLIKHGMKADFSWTNSAQIYSDIYKKLSE